MTTMQRIIRILVGSPSDVQPERDALDEVVQEFNHTWGEYLQVRLDLVRWETHVSPGIGEDAQDVINQQLPDKPDIFVGLMWGRFGTPTKRAGSGTEEEFSRILEQHEREPDSIGILFYFKNASIAPNSIALDQMERVKNFKRDTASEGLLHTEFDTTEDFARKIRQHLSQHVQRLMGQAAQTPKNSDVNPDRTRQIDLTDDAEAVVRAMQGDEAGDGILLDISGMSTKGIVLMSPNDTSESIKTTRRVVAELEAKGLVERHHTAGGTKGIKLTHRGWTAKLEPKKG